LKYNQYVGFIDRSGYLVKQVAALKQKAAEAQEKPVVLPVDYPPVQPVPKTDMPTPPQPEQPQNRHFAMTATLDTIVNQMLLKHRAKLEASQKAMEEAQARMQAEQENSKATKAQVDELLSWAECFDKADIGTKHLIVSRLIERVEVRTGYKLHIKFKISLKQFLGQE